MRNVFRLFVLPFLVLVLNACAATRGMVQEDPISLPTQSSHAGESAPQAEETKAAIESCPELSPHPVAVDIAKTFETDYEQVIGWFCNGHPFEEILLALQTQKISEVEVEVVLAERMGGKSWDQIWSDLGILK